MDKTAQMEAARLLALEFKSGGNPRRGGGDRGGGRGLRGGSGTRGVGVGRIMNNPRSEVPRSSMSRPVPTTSRPALTVGNVNRAPTQINPALADWLGGQRADCNDPVACVPTATREATAPVPVDPKLTGWLTNNSQSQPSANPVPIPNATLGLERPFPASASVPGVTSAAQLTAVSQARILPEPTHLTAHIESPATLVVNNTSWGQPKASGGLFEKKPTTASKLNGLGKSMWASEEPKTAHTQNRDNNANDTVDTNSSIRASSMPQEEPVGSTTTTYDGQVSRLLETVHNKDETQMASIKTGSKLTLRQQPEVGTMLWALQQLDAGLELPDPQQFKAHGGGVNDNYRHVQPVAASQADNVNGAASQSQDQMTENYKTNEALVNDLNCHCPKRSHPVIGLAASKHNAGAEGDVDISGMSTTARNRFAVNVILHDHAMPDCPVLLRTKAKYPLYFGANPATVDDENDGLSVIRWEESHHATRPLAQQSGVGSGLMSSIWAA
ncbi:hypothetical protein ColTof4_13268 [Colletotrichum tofieldiae]|nr:hypothetical protein ColTof3_00653 [Colletotrichum tofieldiae]GKT80845.1 hypothetical protein ColTof4_13268 [Colletotrichum tofieldiae]